MVVCASPYTAPAPTMCVCARQSPYLLRDYPRERSKIYLAYRARMIIWHIHGVKVVKFCINIWSVSNCKAERCKNIFNITLNNCKRVKMSAARVNAGAVTSIHSASAFAMLASTSFCFSSASPMAFFSSISKRSNALFLCGRKVF